MSGAMLKVAIYGLLRFTSVCWPALPAGVGRRCCWCSASAGAVVAVIYANIARDLKRILAWSSVENIGLAFTMFGFQLLLRRGGWPALADARAGGDVPAPARPRALQDGPVPRRGRGHARDAHREDRAAGRPGRRECRGSRPARWSLALVGGGPAAGRLVRGRTGARSSRSWARSPRTTRARSPPPSTVLVGVAFVVGPRRLRDGAALRVHVPRRAAGGRRPRGGGTAGGARACRSWRWPAGVVLLGLAAPWLSPARCRSASTCRRRRPSAASMLAAGSLPWLAPALAAAARRRVRRRLAAAARARPSHAHPPLPHLGLRAADRLDDGVHGHRVLGAGAVLPARHRPRREAPRLSAGRAVEPLDSPRARWNSGRRAACWPGLYFPIARLIEGTGAWLKQLQNGVIQFYIALILATLLLTLWVAL